MTNSAPKGGAAPCSKRVMNLAHFMRQSAKRYADEIGFVWADRTWTWAQLDRRVDAMAAALCARGVTKGDRILVQSKNCNQLFESMFVARTESGALQAAQAGLFLGRVAEVRLRQDRKEKYPRGTRSAQLFVVRSDDSGLGVNPMSAQSTILVTGGASGIGFAIVEAALAEGWRTVVADINVRNLEAARKTLGDRPDVRFEELDVADEDAVIKSIAACEREFGPLTGVVNSAGIGRDVPALDTSAELFRRILDVNLVGSFLVSREAAKAMRGRGAGAIVNMASVSGITGNKGRTAYGASKGGVIVMTKVMAVELAGLGIRVNAIAPGPIETPLVKEMHSEQARAAWMRALPQHRYGTTAEIAGAAMFLLDARKSGFVTGQTICVDGGFTAAGIMSGD
jgi:NAD(P)-dependent dehydrogenase (short-subunit alcohol dehydrogenase family)